MCVGLAGYMAWDLRRTGHRNLEAAERIALPIICFASRRLAVLATPPLSAATSCGAKSNLLHQSVPYAFGHSATSCRTSSGILTFPALAQERSVAILLLRALPAHCGVNAAEAHAQCQGIFDRVCDGGFFHPIQCGVDRIFQIARWMQFTCLHLK